MKLILIMGAVALVLAGCSGSGLIDRAKIASSPEADAMRLCGALVDSTTRGVSIPAISSLVRNALNPAAANKLGADPAEAMRLCADMYDSLAD